MLTVVVVMVLILVVAGLVTAYVAYPHRGEQMPAAPWLGDAMARAAEAAPLIEEDDQPVFALDREPEESEQHR
ncbi:hypothetical protein [Nocardioides sp. YIM 152315]|uniref:hypothetical protein n=1 Tax=Nocardioides sp. YIM 152315 TaxID=3031760 RepID=UPI0023DAA281|nr:hypothetical protein [Nocardioides sp. YIM 152315]MDF1602828.1 hypothetical protein [Nocardioides sp. YIM 152315]